MPTNPERIYWDTCIFIHYLENTEEWRATLSGILADVADGKAVIVTSALTIAEAGFSEIERNDVSLDSTAVERLDLLWEDDEVVMVVDVDPTLALQAREILRRGLTDGRNLRGADAIHLATARRENVSQFHTLDDKLLRWNDEWFPVTHPIVRQLRLTFPGNIEIPLWPSDGSG